MQQNRYTKFRAVQLSADLVEALQMRKDETGVPMSKQLGDAVTEYLNKK